MSDVLGELRAWIGGQAVPTAQDVSELIRKITNLRAAIGSRATSEYDAPRLALIDAEKLQIMTAVKYDAATAMIDAAQWNVRPDAERRKLAAQLDQLFDELRCLTYQERKTGRRYFMLFCGLLFALSVLYVGVHW